MQMKSNIAVLPQRRENRILKRGDIYYADLCGLEQSLGSEQTGRRPVLIIQNDVGNMHSPTTIVAILTTKIKRNLPTHVVISGFAGLSQTSAVCLEQIKTIDKCRLENYCGNIGNAMMQEIEQAIFIKFLKEISIKMRQTAYVRRYIIFYRSNIPINKFYKEEYIYGR